MSRGKIKIKKRLDWPTKSQRGRYSRRYCYWYAECTDEHNGDVITLGISYKELGVALAKIIEHEIKYFEQTPGIVEAKKRRKQLMDAMMVPIKEEERRLSKNAIKN